FLETDASLLGWGVVFPLETVQGQWSNADACWHINYLELLAMFKALRRFESNVLLRVDNKTTVAYVNQQGGTVFPPPLPPSSLDAGMSAGYVLGNQNLIADALSRRVNVMAEAALTDQAFGWIMERWGRLDVDVFVAPSNAKVHLACPDGGRDGSRCLFTGVDFIGVPVSVPPLPLIPLVLEKLERDRVVKTVLV
uniref:RNase H type-1 domain-containing protein n=1 Tax=Latimeria chalumnae TaxID=7897 RepID=H3AI99_LATCH